MMMMLIVVVMAAVTTATMIMMTMIILATWVHQTHSAERVRYIYMNLFLLKMYGLGTIAGNYTHTILYM